MKHRILPAVAVLAALSLAACQQAEPEVVDSRAPDPLAAAKEKAAPVELPPAIRGNVAFRCKDNSLLYVEFFDGDKLVNLRDKRGETPTPLRAPEAGQPYVAEGYSLTGDMENITVTQPGKGEQTCRA
ncbi:hypothetical protein OKW76_15365 [Sphingomonas sp. S1-29]|uniref:C-type lysozyme inhibitor domain-containing protein n=1 Tax=Sphingomonas qomolangmaensis TaxID=2918765 RepID=A0ABY5L8W2_9SPHN|nr:MULTISPECIES: hypothetical protein [Sphingomonas]UUL82882.1 hypothetical protein NMP03_01180 [Sphingomonas qomolangmaensis]UZK69367.1 hypothetical protein OKW76_15365 [Sphingomonas sp. S1-29]